MWGNRKSKELRNAERRLNDYLSSAKRLLDAPYATDTILTTLEKAEQLSAQTGIAIPELQELNMRAYQKAVDYQLDVGRQGLSHVEPWVTADCIEELQRHLIEGKLPVPDEFFELRDAHERHRYAANKAAA
ncbi:MAG: hypothetical protein HYS81_00935 [Candidatus Aenigmatarchaeota archaeon]|nr:MAG: hypothetical protein HYS81_00935 [Candidatus Aenigmarchaeota archaeon]